ncbi:unnamed protein product [Closterium sp. Yama58-4]|nr:unnamed protein product [Closterium sp. Yama58-4]
MALLSAPLTATRGCVPCVAQPLPAPRAPAPAACALPCSARPLPVNRATRRSYALAGSPLAARMHGRGGWLRGWRRASAADDNSAKDTADAARSEDYKPQADVDDVSDDMAEASAAAAELAAEMAGEAAAQAASVYAATAAAEGMEEEEEVGIEEGKGEGIKGAVSAAVGARESAADGAPSDVKKASQQQQEQQQQQQQPPPPSRPLPRQPQASSAPAVAGLRRTVWGQEGVAPQYPPLQEHVTVDVAVVGGGINGLSVAYSLLDKHRKGRGAGGGGKDLSVMVLEARAIGSGQTGRTTAHLMPWNDDYYSVLERLFGRRRAALVGRSHVAAIDWVERVVREHGIECEFERVDGYLFPHDNSDEANRKMLEVGGQGAWLHAVDGWVELAACERIGLSDTSLVDLQGDPALGSLSSALRFPNAADFHPLNECDHGHGREDPREHAGDKKNACKQPLSHARLPLPLHAFFHRYLQGLASAVTAMGGKIYESTRVIRNSSLSTTLELNTGVRVTAGSVVLATNSPINHNLAVHARQSADRTYVVGLAVPKGSVR